MMLRSSGLVDGETALVISQGSEKIDFPKIVDALETTCGKYSVVNGTCGGRPCEFFEPTVTTHGAMKTASLRTNTGA